MFEKAPVDIYALYESDELDFNAVRKIENNIKEMFKAITSGEIAWNETWFYKVAEECIYQEGKTDFIISTTNNWVVRVAKAAYLYMYQQLLFAFREALDRVSDNNGDNNGTSEKSVNFLKFLETREIYPSVNSDEDEFLDQVAEVLKKNTDENYRDLSDFMYFYSTSPVASEKNRPIYDEIENISSDVYLNIIEDTEEWARKSLLSIAWRDFHVLGYDTCGAKSKTFSYYKTSNSEEYNQMLADLSNANFRLLKSGRKCDFIVSLYGALKGYIDGLPDDVTGGNQYSAPPSEEIIRSRIKKTGKKLEKEITFYYQHAEKNEVTDRFLLAVIEIFKTLGWTTWNLEKLLTSDGLSKYNEAMRLKEKEKSDRRKRLIIALVLCLLFGSFGVHRFYLRKFGIGVLYLLTFGVFGFGVLFDIFSLISEISKAAN